jgi:sugar transferase (PEP-CTERM/EpsH1 system associated)
VSDAEAELFVEKTGVAAVESIVNGVDSDFFSRDDVRQSPFPSGAPTVVFTGAMDYWANVDAVAWFAREIWPKLVAEFPEARFYIVGARPTRAVSSLAGGNVFVTGRVPDVRPYLQFATAVIAPMRVARGVQNKVLEGMAMARPVVVTEAGREGLNAQNEKELLVADEPEEFALKVSAVIRGRYPSLAQEARAYVVREHGWEGKRCRLLRLLEGVGETQPEVDP